uniref:Interferon gamma n=1 Tax=Ictidomys tridecemlineatus TaxID=43179 RepID=I3MNV6_ICTTR
MLITEEKGNQCLCIILGSSSYYSQDIVNKEIEALKEYFNASNSNVSDGGSLFLDILDRWEEESDKKVIQSQIVSFYFKLFEHLTDNKIIQGSINTIREDLSAKFFNSNCIKREDFLKVSQFQVNDLKIQRKAVRELKKVMNDLLPHSTLRKRRRSQSSLRSRRANYSPHDCNI